MFDTIYAPLRLLTRLSVRSMPSSESTQAHCLFRNLAHSPLLHDLTVAGEFTAHLPRSVSATSLTHFSAGGLTHSEAWQVLKSANHLVECLFEFRTGGYLPHEHQVLAHPNLRKLTVKNSFRSFSSLFFRYITTRRLTDLAVTIDTDYSLITFYEEYCYTISTITFFDFFLRSAFRLSHFYADVRGEVPLDAARLTRLLELLPDLTQLEYKAWDISTLVSLISPIRLGTCLLPRLKHLHLIPGQLLVDYLPVFVMLDARLRNDSESHCDPLAVFHLTLGHDVEAPSNKLHEWRSSAVTA
ncbi:hypothetical protein C8F01DRAFT_1152244 [Mycena amicta]|nr:hypothetical protein C8F01DRAFT_1152244 [Mycena amicta]